MSALVHLQRGDAPACPEPGEQAEVGRRDVVNDEGDVVVEVQTQYWMSCHFDEVTCATCRGIFEEDAIDRQIP